MSTPTDVVLWSPAQATAWLLEQVGSGRADWDGMCLALTSQAYGYGGSGIGSAADYWHLSWHRHPGDRNVPHGGLACFTGGSGGYGHIMVALDDEGSFASNDIGAQGQVDVCTIADIERAWGLPYEGWAEPCYWAGWGTNPYGPPPAVEQPPAIEEDTGGIEEEDMSAFIIRKRDGAAYLIHGMTASGLKEAQDWEAAMKSGLPILDPIGDLFFDEILATHAQAAG